jgi:flagellar assembly factor FliW
MKIRTTRFGEIEFPNEVVLTFPEGILGFPDYHRYVLLEHDLEHSPFKWLQSVEAPELAFIVLDPMMLVGDYPLHLDSDTCRMIQVSDPNQCAYMVILNIPKDEPIKMTANMKAPLVVNATARLGRQVVLSSQAYSVSENVFPRLNERMSEINGHERAVSA